MDGGPPPGVAQRVAAHQPAGVVVDRFHVAIGRAPKSGQRRLEIRPLPAVRDVIVEPPPPRRQAVEERLLFDEGQQERAPRPRELIIRVRRVAAEAGQHADIPGRKPFLGGQMIVQAEGDLLEIDDAG
jgi:hypothetical protein